MGNIMSRIKSCCCCVQNLELAALLVILLTMLTCIVIINEITHPSCSNLYAPHTCLTESLKFMKASLFLLVLGLMVSCFVFLLNIFFFKHPFSVILFEVFLVSSLLSLFPYTILVLVQTERILCTNIATTTNLFIYCIGWIYFEIVISSYRKETYK